VANLLAAHRPDSALQGGIGDRRAPAPGGCVRFVRRELDVEPFGINWFELPPGAEGVEHDESGPEQRMLEGNTALAALAARTERLQLGLMVGSVTYRNPALHAKITTNIDVISGGRAIHSLGAGWYEDEHRAFGYEFPRRRERRAKDAPPGRPVRGRL
jgi:Luciferase-like monooxygenase